MWVFFSERTPASLARRIGAYLLREAMTACAEIDLVMVKGGRMLGVECKRIDAPRLTPAWAAR